MTNRAPGFGECKFHAVPWLAHSIPGACLEHHLQSAVAALECAPLRAPALRTPLPCHTLLQPLLGFLGSLSSALPASLTENAKGAASGAESAQVSGAGGLGSLGFRTAWGHPDVFFIEDRDVDCQEVGFPALMLPPSPQCYDTLAEAAWRYFKVHEGGSGKYLSSFRFARVQSMLEFYGAGSLQVVGARLPPTPVEVTTSAHWLALEGVQPAIPENVPLKSTSPTGRSLLPMTPSKDPPKDPSCSSLVQEGPSRAAFLSHGSHMPVLGLSLMTWGFRSSRDCYRLLQACVLGVVGAS